MLLTATLAALKMGLCILFKTITFRIVACTVITRYASLDCLHRLIKYMKTFRNSDWPRAVRLNTNSAILCYHSAHLCYHILAGKSLHEKKHIAAQARESQ